MWGARAAWLRRLALFLGATLLVGMILQTDLQEVLRGIRQVGWWFILAFGCYVLSQILTASSWRACLASGRTVRFGTLLSLTWSGSAINQLTPGSTAGEVFKSASLRHPSVTPSDLVASLVVSNVASTLVGLVWVSASSGYCSVALDLEPALAVGLLVSAALTAAMALVLALVVWRGAAGITVRAVTALPVLRRKRDDWSRKADEVDARTRDLSRGRAGELGRAFVALTGVRILQVAEVWALLTPLLPSSGALQVLDASVLVLAAGQVLAWALAVVPGQVGVAEAGSTAVLAAAGFAPPVGLTMELLRRGRKIIGITIGLALAAAMRARKVKGAWRGETGRRQPDRRARTQ